MKIREFKKILFKNPKIDSKFLKQPGNSGRVDLWKNATSQMPVVIVKIVNRFGTMICSTDIDEMTDSHGTVSVRGGHAPNPVGSYEFAKWFESHYADEYQIIRFQTEGKVYNSVSKVQYDPQSGNIDIYLKEKE